MVLASALIAANLLVHRDEGGWEAKGVYADTASLNGHLAEWEWVHVAEAVDLLHGVGIRQISSQNAYRVTGAFLISTLWDALGSLYWAAVAASALVWLAASWSAFALARRVGSGTGPLAAEAAVIAAIFTASGTGFVSFIGNVDAHLFGYAAVGCWLALLAHVAALEPDVPLRASLTGAALLGLSLCIAGYAMEIAWPLLAFVWLYYLGWAATRHDLSRAAPKLAVLSVAFLAPYLAYRMLLVHGAGIAVTPFNDPSEHIERTLGHVQQAGVVAWIGQSIQDLWPRWVGAFPPPLPILAALAIPLMPRRWAVWAVLVAVVMAMAAAVTRPLTRDLYFAFPAVYLLASWGAVQAGSLVATRLGQWGVRRPAAVRRICEAALVLSLVLVTNADLWGNYTLPLRWIHWQ